MLQSLIIAFSTYSKIPMPKTEWNEKGMKYSMCFFPLVGIVIGGINYGLYYLLTEYLEVSSILVAVLLTVVPILLTGGIHLDGFLDTVDAKSSYKEKEEKLAILKDPHVGAFAVIYTCVYFLLYFGFAYQLVCQDNEYAMLVFAISFAFVRALSGLSVVGLKKAKNDGMLASTAKASSDNMIVVMSVLAIVFEAIMIIFEVMFGALVGLVGIIMFLSYRHMAYKNFGGITGDLAGYFLQKTELMILIVLAVVATVLNR